MKHIVHICFDCVKLVYPELQNARPKNLAPPGLDWASSPQAFATCAAASVCTQAVFSGFCSQ